MPHVPPVKLRKKGSSTESAVKQKEAVPVRQVEGQPQNSCPEQKTSAFTCRTGGKKEQTKTERTMAGYLLFGQEPNEGSNKKIKLSYNSLGLRRF